MNTKEIRNVPGLEPEQVVVIKKYNYNDKSALAGKCAKMTLNNMSSPELDIHAYKIFALVYGITKAPFFGVGIDKEHAIKELEADTGEFLFKEVSQFNSLEPVQDLKKE